VSKKPSKVRQQPVKTTGDSSGYAGKTEQKTFTSIPYPVLWLTAAVLVTYFTSFSFGYTELDDTIFIKEFRAFNQDTHNLVVAFTRGLFDAVKDPYYRPLFSDAMIFNYQLSGESPMGYHVVNVLLHLLSVILLFRLFLNLGIQKLHSFLLSLVFAVHPVLSQAVAWIPGRNDTMLAVFVLSFLNYSISYTGSQKSGQLMGAVLFLLLACFTKETAVFAPPAAFILLVLYKGCPWKSRVMYMQYIAWGTCLVVWYLARSGATIQSSGIVSSHALMDFLHRLPVIIQYIGKVVLPFNLSVFPTQEDTVLYFGVAAIALLILGIILGNRQKDSIQQDSVVVPLNTSRINTRVLAAIAFFILFLMPALLVPNELNQQTFEHRLYLPAIGILLLLPETFVFKNKLAAKQQLMLIVGICVVFAVVNIRHQQNFDNPVSFWTQAVETSPNSAYANMSLAARLDKSEFKQSEALFRKAYEENPNEKYLNFYFGEMLQKKDSVLASEPFLLKEKEISDYVKCDFYLARVAMEKGNREGAIAYLERFLSRDRYNDMAHTNLMLIYLEAGQTEKAKNHAAAMKRMGMDVPAGIARQLGM
jgi:protein O-mannosyl-transferase